jgi:hypothetical protein
MPNLNMLLSIVLFFHHYVFYELFLRYSLLICNAHNLNLEYWICMIYQFLHDQNCLLFFWFTLYNFGKFFVHLFGLLLDVQTIKTLSILEKKNSISWVVLDG